MNQNCFLTLYHLLCFKIKKVICNFFPIFTLKQYTMEKEIRIIIETEGLLSAITHFKKSTNCSLSEATEFCRAINKKIKEETGANSPFKNRSTAVMHPLGKGSKK